MKKLVVVLGGLFLCLSAFAGFGGHKAKRRLAYTVVPVYKTIYVYETQSALKTVNVKLVITDTANMKWEIRSDSEIIFIDTKTLKMQTRKPKVAVIRP